MLIVLVFFGQNERIYIVVVIRCSYELIVIGYKLSAIKRSMYTCVVASSHDFTLRNMFFLYVYALYRPLAFKITRKNTLTQLIIELKKLTAKFVIPC